MQQQQQNYTLKQLATDVRTLIDYLHKTGVVGINDIDFTAVTVFTKDGEEIEVDLNELEYEVELPPTILRKIRWFVGRD